MPEQEDVFDTDSVDVEVDEPARAIVNQYESSISIGGVTTLPVGSNATVTNSGTESDVVLNFGIPKGDSGSEWGEISGTLADQTDLKDVLDAKERYEQQIKDTTWLIERIKVYGSKEMQQRAYDNVTAQLKAMDSFLEGLYKETIGEA